MERLTKIYSDGTHGASDSLPCGKNSCDHGVSDSLPCGENSCDYMNLLIEKLEKSFVVTDPKGDLLKECGDAWRNGCYEDLEDQVRLVKLPCKLGDT